MSSPTNRPESVVVTASLTIGKVRAPRGITACETLIEEILALDHVNHETRLWIGDREYYGSNAGPRPNQFMRVSAQPSTQCAALSYTDHDSPNASIVNSYNLHSFPLEVELIFNGETGDMFPQSAVIAISDARAALFEWLQTRSLPTCINWRPFGHKGA